LDSAGRSDPAIGSDPPYRAATSRVRNGLCSRTTSFLAYGQLAIPPAASQTTLGSEA